MHKRWFRATSIVLSSPNNLTNLKKKNLKIPKIETYTSIVWQAWRGDSSHSLLFQSSQHPPMCVAKHRGSEQRGGAALWEDNVRRLSEHDTASGCTSWLPAARRLCNLGGALHHGNASSFASHCGSLQSHRRERWSGIGSPEPRHFQTHIACY